MGKKQTQNINPKIGYGSLGYAQAQRWYETLKTNFFNQIYENLSMNSQQMYEDILNNASRALSNTNPDETSLSKQARLELEKIMSNFIKELMDTNTNVATAINQAQASLKSNQQRAAEEQIKLINQLKNIIIKEIGSMENLKTILEKSLESRGTNIQERYSALLTQTSSLLTRALVEKLGLLNNLYIKTVRILAGFVAEDLECTALEELINKSDVQNIVKVKPGGTITSSKGTQTHMDNILSIVEFEKDKFTVQIDQTANLDIALGGQGEKELQKQIQYFGEQVKTFSLSKKPTTGSLAGARISEQSDMYKEYSAHVDGNVYQLYENIRFVGRYHNILRAFGADTLLFANADGRYFINDFIKEFKAKDYYLLFGYGKGDSGYKVTSTVVLDKPWYSRSKKSTSWITAKPYSSAKKS